MLRVLVIDSLVSTCIHACIVTKTTQEYIAVITISQYQAYPSQPIQSNNASFRSNLHSHTVRPPQAHSNHFNTQDKDLLGLDTSPVNINILQDYQALNPDRDTSMLLLSGFSTGFLFKLHWFKTPITTQGHEICRFS